MRNFGGHFFAPPPDKNGNGEPLWRTASKRHILFDWSFFREGGIDYANFDSFSI
jgi:hypothetical protein